MDIRGLKAMFGCGVVCWGGTKTDSDGFVVRGSLDDFAGFLCRRGCRVDDEIGYRVRRGWRAVPRRVLRWRVSRRVDLCRNFWMDRWRC